MAFILGERRDADVVEAFRGYREYLEQMRARFPPRALALATSDWYFDAQDRRCPHDAWLEQLVLREEARSETRVASLSIELLGAFHDRVLTFTYARVHRYSLDDATVRAGRAWRYDELRVDDDGHLLHEIEWW